MARKDGGVVEHEYNAVGSPAMERAKEKKKGGRVNAEGEKPKAHHGKPGRARGGRIGANLAPLSTAARVKHVTKGEGPEEGEPSS
jgi:hypothetical protein